MKFGIMTHFKPLKPTRDQHLIFFKSKMADGRWPDKSAIDRLKATQPRTEVNRYDADADGAHIGATWRLQLNRPCAAAMRPYVRLLWPPVYCLGPFCISSIFRSVIMANSRPIPFIANCLCLPYGLCLCCCGVTVWTKQELSSSWGGRPWPQ